MSKRRLAALSASGLVAGTMSVLALGVTPANAADTISIDKSLDYNCDVNVTYQGSVQPLGVNTVGVEAQSSIPASIQAGTTVPATPATITLTMSEALRTATVVLFKAQTVDGSSSDSTLGFTVAGHRTDVPIKGLSVTGSEIPQDVNPSPTPLWHIPTSGTVSAIPVPAAAGGQALTLQLPKHFTATALIHGTDSTTGNPADYPTKMDCTIPTGQAGELLDKAIVVKPAATTVSAPAAKGTYGTASTLSYAIHNATTGPVQVLEGSKVLARGSVAAGKGSVKLPATLAIGSHNLTVKYLGSSSALASTGTSKVTIAKAASSIRAAKVTPKKVKAKKTKAKMVVSVASTGGTPTGTVTVTLKGKKVGSAALSGGKATVKLKKFKKAGKQKLTVSFSGSANINGSSKTVTVKVKK